jgi:HPt (histidine-containing phosphotransfer) domain-containing protein
LHGAVRYCGVPRLAKAIEKLELALKQGNELEIQPLLNLLNGEVTALNTWHHDNPDVLSSGDQQIKHR